jgi:hypothetical protein
MSLGRLILRSLVHHWRSHAAVAGGVATSVAVLAGALTLGASVRGSLRALRLERLGNTDWALSSTGYFGEDLEARLLAPAPSPAPVRAACPLIVLEGSVLTEGDGRRASRIAVYGVDDRFWTFHGRSGPSGHPEGREALLSQPLAEELRARVGGGLLLTVPAREDVPGASLFGARDRPGRTVRLRAGRALTAGELGEFSLRPHQGSVRAVFVSLRLLQRALDRPGQVNTVLAAATDASLGRDPLPLAERLRSALRLEDLGLELRTLTSRGVLSLESRTAFISDGLARHASETAAGLGLSMDPILTYLATSMRAGGREVPYSLVTALADVELERLAGRLPSVGSRPPIVLNDWAARDLRVGPGDGLTLEYDVWRETGGIESRSVELEVAGVVPLIGRAADPDLAPRYPGITDSLHLGDWDPPFPIDLDRIRPADEEYWDRYRTTPKAFVRLEDGQRWWRHRLGGLTSIRLAPPEGSEGLAAARETFAEVLLAHLSPDAFGFRIEPVRALGLSASTGVTDFGEYFTYFSFFLLASALLLTGLFFRLGLEQRQRSVGLLRAVGFSPGDLRRLLFGEAGVVAACGGLLGVVAALGYAWLMVLGLDTVWRGAVGTDRLVLQISTTPLLLGVAGAGAMVLLTLVLGLRDLGRRSPRALLSHGPSLPAAPGAGRQALRVGLVGTGLSLGLLSAGLLGVIGQTPAFFASGGLLLVGLLGLLRRGFLSGVGGVPVRGTPGLVWLGLRETAYRPGRSLLCVALIASATFVIVAVAVFQKDTASVPTERSSGSGGYSLLAESLLPLHHDPGTAAGREALGLPEDATLAGVGFARFRVSPGDDLSCLNLYRPQRPTILAATAEFRSQGRFAFQDALADGDETRRNPWLLLGRDGPDGSIPAIADAGSLAYVLHRRLGEEIQIEREGAAPLRLRFVASLQDSVFQSALLIGEGDFLKAFPTVDGYRFFLLETPPVETAEVTTVLEERLSDLGFDVSSVAGRLRQFHEVENTYLHTFQLLGALGLVLGTLGLGAVLARNALERRRDLSLLRAAGFTSRHLGVVLLVENGTLLLLGLVTGTGSALVAVLPAVMERGGELPAGALCALLLAVLGTGLAVSWMALRYVEGLPLLEGLREE